MTPAPEAGPGSGLGPDTEVSWTVALGRAFTNIVAKGSTAATAASDHTVKADIRGLAPATDRTAPGGPRPQPRPVGRHTDDRRELLAHLRDNAIRNTVFHTGDIHMVWANDVPLNAGTYPLSASAATEFVVTSVTSDNIDDLLKVPEGTGTALASPLIHAANRHVHCVDTDRHGYGVLDLTAERAQMDFSVLSDRTEAAATSSWARSYGTRSGTQKVERAYDPV